MRSTQLLQEGLITTCNCLPKLSRGRRRQWQVCSKFRRFVTCIFSDELLSGTLQCKAAWSCFYTRRDLSPQCSTSQFRATVASGLRLALYLRFKSIRKQRTDSLSLPRAGPITEVGFPKIGTTVLKPRTLYFPNLVDFFTSVTYGTEVQCQLMKIRLNSANLPRFGGWDLV